MGFKRFGTGEVSEVEGQKKTASKVEFTEADKQALAAENADSED
jgi:hypothetical protein